MDFGFSLLAIGGNFLWLAEMIEKQVWKTTAVKLFFQ